MLPLILTSLGSRLILEVKENRRAVNANNQEVEEEIRRRKGKNWRMRKEGEREGRKTEMRGVIDDRNWSKA